MALRVVALGSGSRGNAVFVEAGRARLLVDAGLSARALTERLGAIGVAPRSLDAVLLSHEHQDHARGAERFSNRHRVPLACSHETLEALDRSPQHFAAWRPLEEGGTDFGDLRVEAFDVPHDAARPVGFVLHGEGQRVGVVTDLGHATTLVVERLRGCDVLLIESNHDADMLRRGPYPWHLKQRVSGRMGHLSNADAARLLEASADERCRAVVLLHLSENNNTPQLARRAAAEALERRGVRRVTMRVAGPRAPTPAVEL